MDYKKFMEDYLDINMSIDNCKTSQNENAKKLQKDIKESLQDISFQDCSQYFSELFDIWLIASDTTIDIKVDQFDRQELDTRYKTSTLSTQQNKTTAKRKKDPFSEMMKKSTKDRKEKVKGLLDFSSISQLEELPKSKLFIEVLLNQLWQHMFKNNLIFLYPEKQILKLKKDVKVNKYIQKNWPLYELINQIGKTIINISEEGKTKKVNFSILTKDEQENIIADTEALCTYILESSILNPKENKIRSEKWFPEFSICEEVRFPYIIATTDHISYIFEYKLKEAKAKKNYLRNVADVIEEIHNKTLNKNTLYDAIALYFDQRKDDENTFVKYKNHFLDPKLIFIFSIATFQEIIKKALTEGQNNLFFRLEGIYRDHGLTEKKITDRIKKDAKAYMLIYNYLDTPGRDTRSIKEEKLNTWLKELHKLTYGVLDDYLFDLADASELEFEETQKSTMRPKM
jgi:hypothetical protein